MTTPQPHPDCLIIGGGPAGSTAARLLATWGRRVELIHTPRARTACPEETMVPAATGLVVRLRLASVIQRHQMFGTPRRGVCWGSDAVDWRDVADADRGFKVRRDVFDADLLELATAAGAVVRVATRAVPAAETHATTAARSARTRLVASGRDAAPPDVPLTVNEALPETVALAASVADPIGPPDAAVIEAVRAGWWWSLPLADGGTSFTLFADAAEVRDRGRDAVWDDARRGALGPARALDARPLWGVDATARLRSATAGVLLAGDAACAIDPLSSQGLEKAIASAERTALAINTTLETPALAATVADHLRAWHRGVFRRHADETLVFYAREQRFADAPFWVRRHRAHMERLALTTPLIAADALPPRLARNPALHPATALRPRGNVLEPIEAFRLGANGDAVDRIGDLPVAALLHIVETNADTTAAVDAAAAHPQLVIRPRGTVLTALAELHRIGFVVARAR